MVSRPRKEEERKSGVEATHLRAAYERHLYEILLDAVLAHRPYDRRNLGAVLLDRFEPLGEYEKELDR